MKEDAKRAFIELLREATDEEVLTMSYLVWTEMGYRSRFGSHIPIKRKWRSYDRS